MLNDDTANLKSHLKALHADLSQTGAVDAELEALLQQLDGDIRNLLERRTEVVSMADEPAMSEPVTTPLGSTGSHAGPADLSERTQEIAARFAVEHPRLEPALRELGRMLSNMGI